MSILNIGAPLSARRSIADRKASVWCNLRFAILAWRFGSWEDKPLAMIAGMFIGVTAMVTLLRFWYVPPQRVVTAEVPRVLPAEEPARPHAEEYLDAVRYRAAANRAMALSAGALGSTRLRRW